MLLFAVFEATAEGPLFSNQSVAAGIAVGHPGWLSAPPTAPGGAVGDFDNDGWMDVFFATGGGQRDRLFRNEGDGTFRDVAVAAGVGHIHRALGAAVADVNGDGALDLFLPSQGTSEEGVPPAGHLLLYLGIGDGSFRCCARYQDPEGDLPTAFGGMTATFGDYDLDGDLDLFAASWSVGERGNVLLRNEGDESFTVTTAAAGLADDSVIGFASRFADMDGDRFPELLVAGDYGTSRYYRNRGDGTFEDATLGSGTGRDANGMGSAVADLDGDGRLDWYVTSVFTEAPIDRTPGTGNMLYLNRGEHRFVERAAAASVRMGGWGWGVAAVDVDHDGWLDLVATTGWEEPNGNGRLEFVGQPTYLFRNLGVGADGTPSFTDATATVGLSHALQGRGLVNFDYDNDGDQDILIFNYGQAPSLFRNDLISPGVPADAHWLRVLLDTRNDRLLPPNGVGAGVAIRAGGRTQYREIGVGGYFASSELSAHFGLGPETIVEELMVRWPDGRTTVLQQVAADQALVVSP